MMCKLCGESISQSRRTYHKNCYREHAKLVKHVSNVMRRGVDKHHSLAVIRMCGSEGSGKV